MRRTKIIATIGPNSSDSEILRSLIASGVDVARINFSHGTIAKHRRVISLIRKLAKELGRNVGILLDLPGPKIRVGKLKDGFLKLKEGSIVKLGEGYSSKIAGQIPITIKGLSKVLQKGARVLLVDGRIELIVEKIVKNEVYCRVKRGGMVLDHQGVNLPDSELPFPPLTERDKKGIKFGFEEEVEWLALSFVRFQDDLIQLKDIIATRGERTGVIAKIERPEAIRNIEKILNTTDGVMIARGDLGVEMGVEEVPIIQKKITKLCNQRGIPVIIATQMLESMLDNPFPTRAEVSDIANAIYDGADALMLSDETAIGKFPVETVQLMAKVIEEIESTIDYDKYYPDKAISSQDRDIGVHEAIAHAACWLARDLAVKAIIACTSSGFTAEMIAKFRPSATIFALTPQILVVRKLSLIWGINAYHIDICSGTDELIKEGIAKIKKIAKLKKGDLVIVVAGSPPREETLPNLLKIEKI